MQNQNREHRTLLRATDRLRNFPLDHLERAKNAELHYDPRSLGAATVAVGRDRRKRAFHRKTTVLHRDATAARNAPRDRSHTATDERRGVDMVRQHQVAAALAITLALAASLASTASADPAPLAKAEAAIAAAQNRASSTVQPNPDQQTVKGPAAASALASSPASCGDVCSGGGYGFVSPQPPSVGVVSGGGFNWGDAGIGAGVCAVLFGVGLVATRTVTKGRKRRPAERRSIATS